MIKDKYPFKKIKPKHRLILYNDISETEVYTILLSPKNVYAIFGLLVLIFLFSGFLIITTFTPVKNFILNYQQGLHNKLAQNSLKVELLETQLAKQNLYINNLTSVFNGKSEPENNLNQYNYKIDEKKQKIEKDIKKELTSYYNKEFKLSNLILYPPVRGIITDTMQVKIAHFGLDIVAEKNAGVAAVLDGTIIFADWTTHSGYVIHIQHTNNIVSVYKHNAELLKSVGNKVYAGDMIGIVGNTGETSTGPHLHFELWHNGHPLNPKDFIVF